MGFGVTNLLTFSLSALVMVATCKITGCWASSPASAAGSDGSGTVVAGELAP